MNTSQQQTNTQTWKLQRKRLSEQIIAQQQKKLDEFKEEKEKQEKTSDKKPKKQTLAEEIRDQLLRAKSKIVLPNSVVAPIQTTLPPAQQPATATGMVSLTIAPILVPQTSMEPATSVPVVGATVDIDSAPFLLAEPALEVEIKTEDQFPEGPSSSVAADTTLEFGEDQEKKPKKEKRDKSSEEYKEYKRLKKEKRRKEREERKSAENCVKIEKEKTSTPVKQEDVPGWWLLGEFLVWNNDSVRFEDCLLYFDVPFLC